MLDALWERLLVALESRIPATTLETWVRPCRLAAVHGDQLRVAAPSKFARDWLAQRYADALQIAAREVLGGNPRVSFEVDRQPPPPPPPRPATSIHEARGQPDGHAP